MASELAASAFAWLAQSTLALTMALALILALRLPLRRAFGARIAYAGWWLVPACLLAAWLPLAPAAARVFYLPVGAGTALPALVSSAAAGSHAVIDSRPWLLAAWMLGVIATVLLFARRQRAFESRIQRRPGQDWDLAAEQGPAVAGLLRPRILLPSDFSARYNAQEQELVLAHERLHLQRGDVNAQAAASALRCLFWFHPLVHGAARAFRFDQELACDADVLSRFPGARRAYADAMLKTQLADAGLPIGCHWQSSHPLKERLNMLKQANPGAIRRHAGRVLVALVLALGAYTAWAARPAPEDARAERIAIEFSIVVDGAAPATPKLIVREGESFALRLGEGAALGTADDAALDVEMVATRTDGGIQLAGSLRRGGRAPAKVALRLVDGANAEMATLSRGGVVLKARAHTMAPDEATPVADASSAPALARLSPADEMSAPEYPKSALAEGLHGRVTLLVFVDPSGRVTDARVQSAQPRGVFEQAALAAAAKWHFSEAARDTNGKRPSGWMRTDIEFHPDGAPKG